MPLSLDPRWDRLPQFFAGELPEDEACAFREWVEADPERRVVVARLDEIWRLTAAAPRVWDVDAGLAAIQRRTTGMPGQVIAQVGGARERFAPPATRLGQWWTGVAAAAAAVFLVVGSVAVWRAHSASSPTAGWAPGAFTEYTTRRGQRLALHLQDGTLVRLAPASTLRLPVAYGRTERALALDGEAEFVVTHDAARPFVVHTAYAVTRDLGTRFVVRAYAADSATDVVVAEGSVAVRRAGTRAARGADRIVLAAGGRVHITLDGVFRADTGVALEPYFDWTDGRLTFHDTPLAEVARQLTRWRDVEIRLADSATAARRLTATFSDQPVADIMYRIAASLEVEVRRTNRTFTLRAR